MTEAAWKVKALAAMSVAEVFLAWLVEVDRDTTKRAIDARAESLESAMAGADPGDPRVAIGREEIAFLRAKFADLG